MIWICDNVCWIACVMAFKLETETALSTMEAKVIALAACMRELIPIMDMVSLLAVAVGIPAGDVNMSVSAH